MAKKTTYELNIKIGATKSKSFKSVISAAEQSLAGVNSLANKIIAGAAAATAAAAVTATRALSEAMDTYTSFEQEMATVQSISGANASQFEALEEAALQAGRSTIYTAEEAASALEYMSLAGWSVEDSIAGLNPILQLAAATSADLQTTSDLVTDSMSALGIGVDDLDTYLNKVIESNNDANTSAEQLMQALVKTGGASRTLGADLDDTITALDVLANNGRKGEEAGTALNAIFVRLAGNTQAIKELGNLGVDIWDDNGEFVGLEETLTAINAAMGSLTDEQKALSLKNIAGTHYYSQFAYLLDAVTEITDENGNVSTAWDALEGQIADSSGALGAMYGITTDTLENAEKRLQSAVEDMQIQVVDVFSDDAKEFVGWIADKLPEATDSIVAFAEAHKGEFADALESLGEGIEMLWENGIAAGQWLIKNRSAVLGGLKAVAAGIVVVKGAMVGLKIAELFTNPLSAVLTVAGLAAVAIGSIAGAIEDAERAAVEADLAEHFGNITLSLEETDSIARQLIGEDLIAIAETLDDAMSETDSTFSSLNSIWSTLQKDEWKLQMGFELDMDDYQSDIESYVKQAQQYVEDKGYEVHVATTLLLGEDSEIDLENSTYYSQLETELIGLQEQLRTSLQEALDDDGLIDIDEDKIIQEYLTAISNITTAISDAEQQAKLDAITLKYSLTDLDSESFIELENELSEYAQEVSDSALEAYQTSMTALNARLATGDITQEQYDSEAAALKEGWYTTVSKANLQAAQAILDATQEAYPELQSAMEAYEDTINGVIEQYLNGGIDERFWTEQEGTTWDAMADELFNGIDGLIGDEDTKKALQEIQDGMSPVIELLRNDMEMMEEAGASEEAIENIKTFLDTYDQITSIIGNNDTNILSDTGELITGNQDAQDYISSMGLTLGNLFNEETQAQIYEQIDETTEQIAETAYNSAGQYLDHYFNDLGVEYTVDVNGNIIITETVTKNTSTSGTTISDAISEKIATKSGGGSGTMMYRNAEGGIYDHPIITTFAEEGPEAAVPLDGSTRAKSLWVQAGEMLGMFQSGTSRDETLLNSISQTDTSSGTEQSIRIDYNPTVTIQGSATADEVREGLTLGLEDLKEMLKEIQMENARVSFG